MNAQNIYFHGETRKIFFRYSKCPNNSYTKVSEKKMARANSAYSDQTVGQALHCLPFHYGIKSKI